MFNKDFVLGVKIVDGLKKNQILREVVVPDDLPSKIDPIGYVDPNVRIKQMQQAGIRIDAWNRAVYDYEHPDQDDGVTMAVERDDWDELDSLAAGLSEMERYRVEMERYYKSMLKQASAQPEQSSELSGVSPETSVTTEKPADKPA